MTTHLMLDIETLGTRVGSVVLSAALVRFSDEVHTTLNMDRREQHALGLEHDEATMDWWRGQNSATWEASTSNPVPIRPALEHLAAWIQWATGTGDFLIWCHGATFDCPLLEEVYRRAGIERPWPWWSVRDTRTLYDLAGINVKDYAVPPPHVALNDAIAQTRAANAALRQIGERADLKFYNGGSGGVCVSPRPLNDRWREVSRGHYDAVMEGRPYLGA